LVNAAYEGLRGNARAWKAIERERRAWDATLADGLTVAEGRTPYETRRAPRKKRKRE
jgi:hypothetical protein